MIFLARHCSSRKPWGVRWMTRMVLFSPLTQPSANLFPGLPLRNDAVPMSFDHPGELLERLGSLPLECVVPVLEEFPGPDFAFVAPQLAEGFFKAGKRCCRRLAASSVLSAWRHSRRVTAQTACLTRPAFSALILVPGCSLPPGSPDYAFFTNSDFSFIGPIPSILQSIL